MNMHKALSALVVMLGVSVGTSHPLLAQSEITARIDGIVEDYISEGNFHGSLLVASSEGVIYTASYGAANHEWDIPNSLDTKYRIASLTKAFTSVLVFQLIQENKLSLEGTISDYLPSYREDTGRQVSIHHLLNHTSGIADIPAEDEDSVIREYFSAERFLQNYASGDLQTTPGSEYSYSNVGYFILGMILEEVTGVSYAELIEQRIFGPLEMHDSGLDLNSTVLKKRAQGYKYVNDSLENAHYVEMALFNSFGGLYSTVEDLYKWERALHSGALLSDDMKQIMYTHRNNRPTGYANGWFLNSENIEGGSMSLVGVGGSISGFSTTIQRIIDSKDVVIVLNNVWEIGEIYLLAAEILEVLQEN